MAWQTVYQHICATCGRTFESHAFNHKRCSVKCGARPNGGHKYREPSIAKPQCTTQRTCLKCRKPFMSWGPGNRLCGICRHDPDRPLDRH